MLTSLGLLGPILGRFFVDYGGRNAYASLMLAVSVLSCKPGNLDSIRDLKGPEGLQMPRDVAQS